MYSGGFSYFFPHTLKFFASFSPPPPTVVLILFALATQRDELSKWAMEGGCWVGLQGVAIGGWRVGGCCGSKKVCGKKKLRPLFKTSVCAKVKSKRWQNASRIHPQWERQRERKRELSLTQMAQMAHTSTQVPHTDTRTHANTQRGTHTRTLCHSEWVIKCLLTARWVFFASRAL